MKPVTIRGSGVIAEGGKEPLPSQTHLVHIFLVCSEMTPHCCRNKEQVKGAARWREKPGSAAHRRQERSDLIGPQCLVTDAAVVVVLK